MIRRRRPETAATVHTIISPWRECIACFVHCRVSRSERHVRNPAGGYAPSIPKTVRVRPHTICSRNRTGSRRSDVRVSVGSLFRIARKTTSVLVIIIIIIITSPYTQQKKPRSVRRPPRQYPPERIGPAFILVRNSRSTR